MWFSVDMKVTGSRKSLTQGLLPFRFRVFGAPNDVPLHGAYAAL